MLSKLIKKYPNRSQRFLEILPGAISWFLILFPIWGSLVIPVVVAYYIIAFDIYWLYQSVWSSTFSLLSYLKIEAYKQFDWLGDTQSFPDWEKIHHIIIIPTYKEPLATLKRTLRALKKQTFPKKAISVVVSFETREGQAAKEKALALKKIFNKTFANLIITFHPDLPGELKGKSSNVAWAAKLAKQKLIDEQGLDIKYLTITSEDADAVLHPRYLACLSFKFLDDPQRYYRIWQPAIQYYNNIWRLPAISRAYNRISSVVQTGVLMRKDRLMNFSTYSTSLKMADKIGYWDTDVIPEDYRFFFKAFFRLQGKVEVEPIFLPVYTDAAESTSFFKTIKNQYEQVKRWAWGVSDDAYIIKNWILAKNIPFWEKTTRSAHVIKDHLLWPVTWFAITIGANIPPLINQDFARTTLGKTLPQVSSAILTLCLISMLAIIYVDAKQKPQPTEKRVWWKRLFTPLEFVLLPVAGFLFTALPGIDAHTRLMLGRYIEYRVTEKV
ncbi:hypothetical protein KKD62_03770 [Patescibacteria group bacterium]|nr:hypothetical protein [Patescibacteria group bacterium]